MQAEFQERRQWISPWLRGALYGLGPIVLAVFGVAVYRLGGTALRSRPHLLIALSAAAAALSAPIATVWIMLCAGGLGLFLFYRRSVGVVAVLVVALALIAARVLAWTLCRDGAAAVAHGAAQDGGRWRRARCRAATSRHGHRLLTDLPGEQRP
jgi:chromate transport protein ChrA